MTKICGKCLTEKSIEFFSKSKQTKDGYRWECNECRKKDYYENHEKMLEQKRNDHQKHKQKRNEKDRERYVQNKEQRKLRVKEYQKKNKNNPEYFRNKNRDEINLKRREQRRIKNKENPETAQRPLFSLLEKCCNKCKQTKTIWEFNRRENGTKISSRCKQCQSISWVNYANKNREVLRKKDRENSKTEDYRQRKRNYKKSEKYRNWEKKYKSQAQVKIANRLRARMRTLVKDYSANKTEKTLKYIGCSLFYLEAYLRMTMNQTMTWNMFMNGNLHIDHIKPCAAFNLTQESEIHKCFNYKNLRLLHESDNCSKATKDKKLKFTHNPSPVLV